MGLQINSWRKASLCTHTYACVTVGAFATGWLSKSNGNCVQVGAFATPSRSQGNGQCVRAGAFISSSLSESNGHCVEAGAFRSSELSHANGNCVKAGAVTKAELSTYNGACVEAGAFTGGHRCQTGECVCAVGVHNASYLIAVYDSKDERDPDKVLRGEVIVPTLWFTLNEWHKLLTAIKAGDLDGDLFGQFMGVTNLDEVDENDVDLFMVNYHAQVDLGGTTLIVELTPAGFVWSLSGQPVQLTYTLKEMIAFILGAKDKNKEVNFDLSDELELERLRELTNA